MARLTHTKRTSTVASAILAVLAACALGACSSEKEAAAVVPPATPGDPAVLVGTTWEVGPYILEFSEPPVVHVSGDRVPIRSGVDVEWSVDERGVIEIGGYGQHFAGTWDGSDLIVRGQKGVKLSGSEEGDEAEQSATADGEDEGNAANPDPAASNEPGPSGALS